jgi:high-affinity iron transporter
MASQAARFLIQANLLPSFDSPVWDTSAIVENSSIAGKVLQSLMGYDATPAAMQIAFFVAALVVIWAGMAWAGRRQSPPQAT